MHLSDPIDRLTGIDGSMLLPALPPSHHTSDKHEPFSSIDRSTPGSTYRGRRRRRSNPPFPASPLMSHGPWPRNTRALAPVVGGWIEGGQSGQGVPVHQYIRKLVTSSYRRMPKCLDRDAAGAPQPHGRPESDPAKSCGSQAGISVHGLWALGRAGAGQIGRGEHKKGMACSISLGERRRRSERATHSIRAACLQAREMEGQAACIERMERNKVDCPQNWGNDGRGSRIDSRIGPFIFSFQFELLADARPAEQPTTPP